MEFRQFYTPGLAHCSYLAGDKKVCVIVDPAREAAQYMAAAESLGLKIEGIIETHLHADFISGHIELSAATGAPIYITEKARAEFTRRPLKDGEEFRIGSLLFKMLDTPGHTPESSVYLVSDLERGPEPALAFTGDTLMVGDAGRPDLFPELKEELASRLYGSLRKMRALADSIEIYPAHGAGSLCGKALSSKLSSTIGTEKLHNPAMKMLNLSEGEFKKGILKDMPEAPDHFSRCSEKNRKGPPLVSNLSKPAALRPEEFYRLSRGGFHVVDTRGPLSFGAAHVPGAYGLSLSGNFATFSGWVLPPDKPLLLVLGEKNDMVKALAALYSVGLDNVAGYLDGGMEAYAASGLETARLESVSVSEARERHNRGEILLVDARLKSEWEAGHIAGSVHVPAPDVRHRFRELLELAGGRTPAFICASGVRSMLAGSLMLRFSGVKNVINVIGGMGAWSARGFELAK